MKRKNIASLNDSLFDALERISAPGLEGEELERELRRAESVTKIAGTLIHSGELQLKAMKHGEEYGYFNSANRILPALLTAADGQED